MLREPDKRMESVTIMVNNSLPRMLPPGTVLTESQRVIAGPVYELSDVQAIARSKGTKGINVITKDCQEEVTGYFLDASDLQDMILELKQKDYHNSLWCLATPKSPWFAADAYRLLRIERDNVQRITVRYQYYLKFAISQTGSILLFFSVHRDIK